MQLIIYLVLISICLLVTKLNFYEVPFCLLGASASRFWLFTITIKTVLCGIPIIANKGIEKVTMLCQARVKADRYFHESLCFVSAVVVGAKLSL